MLCPSSSLPWCGGCRGLAVVAAGRRRTLLLLRLTRHPLAPLFALCPTALSPSCASPTLRRLMESRFPISSSAGHAQVQFAWFDAFRPTKRAEQASLHFEKAAVAFNLGAVQVGGRPGESVAALGRGRGTAVAGAERRSLRFAPRAVLWAALQSQLALACDRKTDAGLKESAKLFQVGGLGAVLCCASWAEACRRGWWEAAATVAARMGRPRRRSPAPPATLALLFHRPTNTGVGGVVCLPARHCVLEGGAAAAAGPDARGGGNA